MPLLSATVANFSTNDARQPDTKGRRYAEGRDSSQGLDNEKPSQMATSATTNETNRSSRKKGK
jgi:hypothetical protein